MTLARSVAVRLLDLPITQRVGLAAVRRHPQRAIETLVHELARGKRFATVASWPERLEGFEDLAFLFSANHLNHGIALLTFDEAALLWRLGRGARRLVEIGRFKGGSTLILAAAMAPEGRLWSYDSHVELEGEIGGPQRDTELRGALERYGLAARVVLVVGDSRTAAPPEDACDIVFLDGDHSYEGVRADYERWREQVRPGGHLLFHDAGGATPHEGVVRLVGEVDRELFERRDDAGSIAHFVRR